MTKLKLYGRILSGAAKGFMNDHALKFSASLSYYTIFAMGPLLIIIISLAGVFFGRDAVQGTLYSQISGLVGPDVALQIQQIIANIQNTQASSTGAVLGAVFLVIGATGVFTEMQDSINYILSVKAKPKKGWLKLIINRLLSFSLIVVMSFILLASLVVNALMTLLSDRIIDELIPNYSVQVLYTLNTLIMLVVISLLFTVIFKVLPDAVIALKDAIVGAVFTALLFLLGKFLIGYYIGNARLGITYGAAASVIIILSWIYYTAIILYFGAEFTKMFALYAGGGIRPKDTAVFIIKSESKEVPTLQPKEKAVPVKK